MGAETTLVNPSRLAAALDLGAGPAVRPAHFALLDLQSSDEVQAIFSRLAPLIAEAESEGEIAALLDSPNWRLHLIAAAALLLRGPSPGTLDALWERIEVGSWVAARLAALAFLLDDRFAGKAKAWIEARYGPPSPPRGGIDGIWNVFSGQTATALLALLKQLPETGPWVADWEGRPTLAEALAEGGEAGRTALDWRDGISAEIGTFAVWRRA